MGQCAKGAACPFNHQFAVANKTETTSKPSTEDKNIKFTVKNDSASEERQGGRHSGRDEYSRKSRDRDENSRHSDDSGRQRRPRQEANVVFELPNSRRQEQRPRSNSDARQNNKGREREQHSTNNNNNNGTNNAGRRQEKQQGRQDRESTNTAVSFAGSKEERQRMREQERAKAEASQKASFGVKSLSTLVPGKEDGVGTKRVRDSSASEESPNKRRKVESAAQLSKDDLDRELDELELPAPGAAANDNVNDEELLDI